MRWDARECSCSRYVDQPAGVRVRKVLHGHFTRCYVVAPHFDGHLLAVLDDAVLAARRQAGIDERNARAAGVGAASELHLMCRWGAMLSHRVLLYSPYTGGGMQHDFVRGTCPGLGCSCCPGGVPPPS
jgi:hypothetical protein